MRNRVNLYVLILFVMFSCGNGVRGASQNEWKEHINAGLAAIKQNQDATAKEEFLLAIQEAEKFGPNDGRLAHSLNDLGALYVKQGEFEKAEPILERAV